MFFKSFDKIFDDIKHIISIVSFVFISMAILMLLYWFAFCAKLSMPSWLNSFVWAVIDFFAQSFKNTPSYRENIEILPVLTSVIFGVLTYIANCLLVFFDNYQKSYRKSVDNYKEKLAKTINKELHKDFVNELKKNTYMLVKIKVVAEQHVSYLTAMTDTEVNSRELEKEIEKLILESVQSNIVYKKGEADGSVYFVISSINDSKEFLTELVEQSSKLIKNYLRPKLKIGFYCGAALLNKIEDIDSKAVYLNRIIDLKIPNKIVVTPRFKLYFDNIQPNAYNFLVLGEYNLSGNPENRQDTMLYALQRK